MKINLRRTIPQAVIAVVADHVASVETHASLDRLFKYVGCPGDPPEGSKHVKVLAWLRATNAAAQVNPTEVVAKIVEAYMEKPLDTGWGHEATVEFRRKLTATLSAAGLQYRPGGTITGSLAAPTRTP
jgi:hypothetical protein